MFKSVTVTMDKKKLNFLFFSTLIAISGLLLSSVIITQKSNLEKSRLDDQLSYFNELNTSIESFGRSIYMALIGLSSKDYDILLKQREYSSNLKEQIELALKGQNKKFILTEELLKEQYTILNENWNSLYSTSIKILRSKNREIKGNPLLNKFESLQNKTLNSLKQLTSLLLTKRKEIQRKQKMLNNTLPFLTVALVFALGFFIYVFLMTPLDKSREQLNDILEDQTEFIIRFDNRGNIIFFNSSFKSFFNISQKERPHLSQTVLNDDFFKREDTISFNEKLFSNQESLSFQSQLTSNDNQIIIRWTVRKIMHEPNKYIFQAVGQDISKDITNQRIINEQQAQLFATAKLSSLGEMAGGIAHEINNPLAIISSLVQMLKKAKSKNKLTDEVLEDVIANVENTVQRITKIVSGLRTVSRDTSETKAETTPLKVIFDDVLGLCSEKFKNNAVLLEFDTNDNHLMKEVLVDRVQISQVFINLLGNAYDAVEELPEKWIKIELKDKDSTIEIRVIDSGYGIPVEIQDKMFNPFFTSKAIGKGTGLGLSISSNIVKKNGGELKIDNSHPNTCFVLSLPKFSLQNIDNKKVS